MERLSTFIVDESTSESIRALESFRPNEGASLRTLINSHPRIARTLPSTRAMVGKYHTMVFLVQKEIPREIFFQECPKLVRVNKSCHWFWFDF